jgi:hypothetical protein
MAQPGYDHRERGHFESDLDAAHSALDPRHDPEEQLADCQRRTRLVAVLNALPERDQHCVHLRGHGFRYRDIARVLGISVVAGHEAETPPPTAVAPSRIRRMPRNSRLIAPAETASVPSREPDHPEISWRCRHACDRPSSVNKNAEVESLLTLHVHPAPSSRACAARVASLPRSSRPSPIALPPRAHTAR